MRVSGRGCVHGCAMHTRHQPSVSVSVCVMVARCTVGTAGAIPTGPAVPSNQHGQLLDLASPLLTARCAQHLPVPKALQNDLDPCSEAIFPCPRPGWSHWPKSQGWSLGPFFGCSLRPLRLPFPSDAQTLCAPNHLGWGEGRGCYECHRRRHLLSLFQRK